MFMKRDFYTRIKDPSETETVIEKSRFLGFSAKTETEEEAREFIAKIKKRHPFATHNCYAFVAEKGEVKRFSDDGEPQGTAGQPILEGITKTGLSDTCVVVTRYFGGIKLGAGGLVRAYSGACLKTLDSSGKEEVRLSDEYKISLSYDAYSAFLKFSEKEKAKILSQDFGESITVVFAVPKEKGDFEKTFADFSAGKIALEKTGERYEVYDE